jgi:hypothetical protein
MSELVGTWRLCEYSNVIYGKQVRRDLTGMFIYTSNGHVSIHINRRQLPGEDEVLETNIDEGRMPWYIGYYGSYVVDWERGLLIHHVEGGTLVNYLETAQERPFSIEGDKLFIGVKGKWERHLIRVE